MDLPWAARLQVLSPACPGTTAKSISSETAVWTGQWEQERREQVGAGGGRAGCAVVGPPLRALAVGSAHGSAKTVQDSAGCRIGAPSDA